MQYPVTDQGPPSHIAHPEDKQNYIELLKLLKKEMGSNGILSIAYPAARSFLDLLDFRQIAQVVDWINFMT
jgi:GH18 family chitinase